MSSLTGTILRYTVAQNVHIWTYDGEGRSISSRTNCFQKITVNNNSKGVLSFFNTISLQINIMFPAFHKSPEANGIEIFVNDVENFRTCCWSFSVWSPPRDSVSAPNGWKSLGAKSGLHGGCGTNYHPIMATFSTVWWAFCDEALSCCSMMPLRNKFGRVTGLRVVYCSSLHSLYPESIKSTRITPWESQNTQAMLTAITVECGTPARSSLPTD